MKKFLFLLTIAVLLLSTFSNSYAEDAHICPNCGTQAAGNKCYACGHTYDALLPELGEHEAYLSLKFVYDKNIVLAKYDMDVQVDGVSIGTIKQKESLEKIIAVEQGVHQITLQGNDKIKASILIDVEKGSLFSCTLKAHMTSLELLDVVNSSPASDKAAQAYHISKEYGSCSDIDYELVCRYPERFEDQPMHLNGVVVSVSEYFVHSMEVVIQDKQNNLWLIQYKRNDNSPRLLLNDSVEIYGHYEGINNHQVTTDRWVHLPTVELEYLRIN